MDLQDSTIDTDWTYLVEEWHVVFEPGPRRKWWDWLLHNDFRHVQMFAWVPLADAWLIVNSTHVGTRILMVPDGDDMWHRIGCWKANGARILRASVSEIATLQSRTGLWCVPVTKHVLGVKSGAWRPQALYRDMIKAGATPSFEVDHHESLGAKGR